MDAVRSLRVDVDGLYHQEEQLVALKSAMVECAKRRVLLVDGTKFGQSSSTGSAVGI